MGRTWVGLLVAGFFATVMFSFVQVNVSGQMTGVVTLRDALKGMLQKKGARSLRKRAVTLTQSEQEEVAKTYGFDPNEQYVIYTGIDEDKQPIGYAVVVDIEGKEGPLQLVVAVNKDDGQVYDIGFTVFGEERGKPAMRKSFMSQFIGYNKGHSFRLGKDVIGITGATHTSSAVALGVQHGVCIVDFLGRKNAKHPQ